MKHCSFLLIGMTCLFLATAAEAHHQGYGGGYVDWGPTGGVSVWGDSYGNFGYAGTLGFGTGPAWVPAPYPRHVHGPACGYAPRHGGGWRKGYRHGYRHGWHNGKGHGRGHGRGHHRH